MFRRRIPFNQIVFATVLGVVGGVYIYKPLFEAHRKPADAPHQDLQPESEEQRPETTRHQQPPKPDS